MTCFPGRRHYAVPMPQNPSDDNIARDKFGRPILDRYGRPVQRRDPTAGQDSTRVFGDGRDVARDRGLNVPML